MTLLIILVVFQIVLGILALFSIPYVSFNKEPSPTLGAITGLIALLCFTTAYYLI